MYVFKKKMRNSPYSFKQVSRTSRCMPSGGRQQNDDTTRSIVAVMTKKIATAAQQLVRLCCKCFLAR